MTFKVKLAKIVMNLFPEEIVDKLQKTIAVRHEAVHSPGIIDSQKVKKAAEILWEITKVITHIMA